jgi:hypothetical protein
MGLAYPLTYFLNLERERIFSRFASKTLMADFSHTSPMYSDTFIGKLPIMEKNLALCDFHSKGHLTLEQVWFYIISWLQNTLAGIFEVIRHFFSSNGPSLKQWNVQQHFVPLKVPLNHEKQEKKVN